MKKFMEWGKQVGHRALEELYYILRDEIPMHKFYWQTFFVFATPDGLRRSMSVPEGKNAGEVLLDCINGNQEFCGSQGCVAGWACSTHPHLLTWKMIPGLGEDLILTKDIEKVDNSDWIDVTRGTEAFAEAFEIRYDEAHRIVYGFEEVTEDEEEEKGREQAEWEHMLEVISEVLSCYDIKVQAQRPDYLA